MISRRRNDVGLRNNLILARHERAVAELVVAVNVCFRYAYFSAVDVVKSNFDVRERNVLILGFVIAVYVKVGVDISGDNDRFGREIVLGQHAGSRDPFVANFVRRAFIYDVGRKLDVVVRVVKFREIIAFIFVVKLIDKHGCFRRRLIMSRRERRGHVGTCQIAVVLERTAHFGAFDLSAVRRRFRIRIRGGRLIFVEVYLKDKRVAFMEIGKGDGKDLTAVFDLIVVADFVALAYKLERDVRIDAVSAFGVKDGLARVEPPVLIFIEIDDKRVERRSAAVFAADPRGGKDIPLGFHVLFGVHDANRDRIGSQVFAFFQFLNAASPFGRGIVICLRTSAALPFRAHRRFRFDRLFRNEMRHASDLSRACFRKRAQIYEIPKSFRENVELLALRRAKPAVFSLTICRAQTARTVYTLNCCD